MIGWSLSVVGPDGCILGSTGGLGGSSRWTHLLIDCTLQIGQRLWSGRGSGGALMSLVGLSRCCLSWSHNSVPDSRPNIDWLLMGG